MTIPAIGKIILLNMVLPTMVLRKMILPVFLFCASSR